MTAGRDTTVKAGVRALLLAAALMLLPVTAEAKPRHRGIDVSRFQGTINWERVGQTQNSFVWAQASRGRGNDCRVVPDACGADPTYRFNYRGARAAGLKVGAYHRAFAQGSTKLKARQDARAEADLFIRRVTKLRSRDLVPALDVEAPFVRLNERRLRLWIRTWLDRVQNRLGAKPIIYTNNSSWQATGNVRRFASRGHKLWVANYGVPSPLVPADNWAGRGWKVWQFTSSGSVKGIQGDVDKNRVDGGLRSLRAGR